MIRKVVKILWIFIALISLVCVFIFFSIAKGWIGYMPPVEDLENPNYKFATEVFSEDGKVLGTYSYSKENRVFVGYNDLSPNIINALIATEDVRFAEHSGIDAYALTRAVVKRGILMQKNAGGGSTITQQLSKQLYSPSADNVMERLFQKPIEWVIAVKLERYYTVRRASWSSTTFRRISSCLRMCWRQRGTPSRAPSPVKLLWNASRRCLSIWCSWTSSCQA